VTGPENLLKWMERELAHHLKVDVGALIERNLDPILKAGVASIRGGLHTLEVDAVAKAKALVGRASKGVVRSVSDAVRRIYKF
jgi:hypothetical protein